MTWFVQERTAMPALLRRWLAGALVFGHCAGLAATGVAEEDAPTADTPVESSRVNERLTRDLSYGEKGIQYTVEGNATDLWLGLRFQTRIDNRPGDLETPESLSGGHDAELELRRGRIKGGGTLWWEWLDVYAEYDFPSNRQLDLRATFTYRDWLDVRVGQWKSEFSRERIDSSGKQQLVERSISNYWFTVDRQRGVGLSARFAAGSRADTLVWFEALSGMGRGTSFSDDAGLWLGRVQWNPAGEPLPFSQGDLKRRARPLPAISLATVIGRTPYTRFSSSGGGSLPGFEPGDYDLRQLLFETAVHYRGLGWQQELHYKRLEDRDTGTVTRIVGGYAQLGVFPNEWWPSVPARLELVARGAIVDPDRDLGSNLHTEWTIAANWYIQGHRHKLTADYSWLDIGEGPAEDPAGSSAAGPTDASGTRFRLQWELSL